MEKLTLNKDYQDLILQFNIQYFIELNVKEKVKEGVYSNDNVVEIYVGYNQEKTLIKEELKRNKKQHLYYLYGNVIHMFNGGLLPSLFRLNDNVKDFIIFDFKGVGKNWAQFEVWQKHERFRKKMKDGWDIAVKIGTILAYLLSILKLIDIVRV